MIPIMNNRKRYQIFVSSTYADLSEERGRVIGTIFKFDCIPAGLQSFPAMDVDLFEYIKREIDESDYFLLIIGGRYGSVDKQGVSWTEREYNYAVQKGIPVLAFDQADYLQLPANKTDQDGIKREKLIAFKKKVSRGRLIKTWTNADDLELAVANSLPRVFEMAPRLGWVRANSVVSRDSQKEIERLNKKIEKQQDEIKGLEADLKKKDKDIIALESSLQALQEKNVRFQEERLKASQDQKSDLKNIDDEKENQQFQNEIDKLREEKHYLQSENDELGKNQTHDNTALAEERILKVISEAIKEKIDYYIQKDIEVEESKSILSDDIPIVQPKPNKRNRVFISYRFNNIELKNNDEGVALEIQKALVEKGYECCMTSKELGVDTWVPEINKEISKCDVFILVLSKNSYENNDTNLNTKPDNVLRALAFAQRKDKAVCVFRIDKSQPDETLMRLLNPYMKGRAIDASGAYKEKISELIKKVDMIFNTLNSE